ncbi:MAG TPA: hypothetical protein VHZ03_19335 [Trebonia sp.]|nr:hypothetical protein [Trebonia sp.]
MGQPVPGHRAGHRLQHREQCHRGRAVGRRLQARRDDGQQAVRASGQVRGSTFPRALPVAAQCAASRGEEGEAAECQDVLVGVQLLGCPVVGAIFMVAGGPRLARPGRVADGRPAGADVGEHRAVRPEQDIGRRQGPVGKSRHVDVR